MKQSPSWGANMSLGSQEIPPTLRNPRFVTKFTRAHHLSYAEPNQSNPRLPIPFVEDPFWYYPPIYA